MEMIKVLRCLFWAVLRPLLPRSPWMFLQPLLIFFAPDLLWKLLAQVEKVLVKSSQIFLRPLLILPIKGCILTSVEMSVDPPEISQRLPSLPVLWPLLIFPV